MTNSITPPPELVQEWWESTIPNLLHIDVKTQLCIKAAQWGADQELEACVDWMKRMGYWGDDGKAIPALRAARRPKPPSLKERIAAAITDGDERAALLLLNEALPND